MIKDLEQMGFYLSSLENVLTDASTGRLLQVDAIFLRQCMSFSPICKDG